MIKRFRYEGFLKGRWIEGNLFAFNQRQALARLESRKVVVDSLATAGGQRISGREWLAFTQGMAGLLGTGVPLKEAGDLWLDEDEKAAHWRGVFSDVTAGKPFANALRDQVNAPAILVAMVRMGEATGQLDDAFHQAAQALEARQKLQSAIWGALAYPMVVLLVATIAMAVLFAYVLPIFSELYRRYQTDLPWLTSQLMALLDWGRQWAWFLGLGLLVALVALIQLNRQPNWHYRFHHWLLRLPLIGKHIAAYQQIQFCQALGQLLGAGVGLLEALRITEPSLSNAVWRKRLASCLPQIEQGASPAACFAQAKVLNPKLARMATLGEEAGQLAKTLRDLGRLEKADLDRRLATHISLLEPLLIVGMALVIGTVLVALYLPMFDIVNIME